MVNNCVRSVEYFFRELAHIPIILPVHAGFRQALIVGNTASEKAGVESDQPHIRISLLQPLYNSRADIAQVSRNQYF